MNCEQLSSAESSSAVLMVIGFDDDGLKRTPVNQGTLEQRRQEVLAKPTASKKNKLKQLSRYTFSIHEEDNTIGVQNFIITMYMSHDQTLAIPMGA